MSELIGGRDGKSFRIDMSSFQDMEPDGNRGGHEWIVPSINSSAGLVAIVNGLVLMQEHGAYLDAYDPQNLDDVQRMVVYYVSVCTAEWDQQRIHELIRHVEEQVLEK